jgi:hypothetical protein
MRCCVANFNAFVNITNLKILVRCLRCLRCLRCFNDNAKKNLINNEIIKQKCLYRIRINVNELNNSFPLFLNLELLSKQS